MIDVMQIDLSQDIPARHSSPPPTLFRLLKNDALDGFDDSTHRALIPAKLVGDDTLGVIDGSSRRALASAPAPSVSEVKLTQRGVYWFYVNASETKDCVLTPSHPVRKMNVHPPIFPPLRSFSYCQNRYFIIHHISGETNDHKQLTRSHRTSKGNSHH
jgi:hypothetical protein